MRGMWCALLLLSCGSNTSSRAVATGGGAGSGMDAAVDVAADGAGGNAGTSGTGGTGGSAGTPCPTFAEGVVKGSVASTAITEASGIVASRKYDGVLYVHNDSGDSARFFALGSDGSDLGEYALSGAGAVDWEDLALGPGPVAAESYVYLGDIGNNNLNRPQLQVYRVPEPAQPSGPGTSQLGSVETFVISYADGAHNAEAMMVDPSDQRLVIVTKDATGTAQVFQSPAALPAGGGTLVLDEVARLQFGQGALVGSPLVTGGDISADGRLVALRTYTHAYLWRRAPGQTLAAALATPPCPLPTRAEAQGEAIGFVPDASGYYTVSEGSAQALYFFARN